MACEYCGKNRPAHRTMTGRQWDEIVVTVDICFLCCAEEKRGQYFDRKTGRYQRPAPPDLSGSADDQIPF